MNNKEVVLISGGSGLIGNALSEALRSQNYEVRILTRNKKKASVEKFFYYWNVEKPEFDEDCLNGVSHLFNLSGSSVGEGLWTKRRKSQLVSSRIYGTQLIYEKVVEKGLMLTSYYGASAVGYYGSNETNSAHAENEKPGQDFLSGLCYQWEKEHLKFKKYCKNLYIGRISNVVSINGGFIQPLRTLSQLKLRIFLGKGDQLVSWIHLDDLVKILINSIKTDHAGTYNLNSSCVTWKKLQTTIYNGLGKQWITMMVPDVFLKTMMKDMSILILGSSNVSNQKILNSPLVDNMISIDEAMRNVINLNDEIDSIEIDN